MRILAILITILLGISSCNQAKNKYLIEDQIFQCSCDSMATIGIDFKAEVEAFESYLIKQGILENSAGNSYRKLFKKMNAEGGFLPVVSEPYSLMDTLYSHATPKQPVYLREACHPIVDSLKQTENYKTSKLKQLDDMLDSAIRHGLQANDILEDVLTILTLEDFEHDYFKTRILTGMAMARYDLQGIPHTKSPPVPEDAYLINIDSLNRISINGVFSKVEDIEQSVYDFLSDNASNPPIVIQIRKQTSYRLYIDLQNSISQAYQKILDETAKATYGIKFEDLDEIKQETVRNNCPELNIIEPPVK